ncbi:MAG: hypothetical protein ACLR5P_09040 [[Eubacterium] siraeum]
MNAIYTVIENGRESFFSSKTAGGYSYPFLAYGSAKKMANALNESGFMGKVSASEMFPLMRADEHFPKVFAEKSSFSYLRKRFLRPGNGDVVQRFYPVQNYARF